MLKKSLWLCIFALMPLWRLNIESPPVSLASDLNVADDLSPVIRISSNLVTIPVSVTDNNGRPVTDLDIHDFHVEEDGRPETLWQVVHAEDLTLRLVLLIDLSGSLNHQFDVEQHAAIRFLENTWKEGDTISIAAFDDYCRFVLIDSHSLEAAKKTLSALKPGANPTAFFDAVISGAQSLYHPVSMEARHAIIALSDGEDNKSRFSLADAVNEVQRANAIFYAINPAGSSIRLNEISMNAHSNLSILASETGGAAFLADKATDLEKTFSLMATELRAQYLLSYLPANSIADGKYRSISVSTPRRKDLRIRSRRGYFASFR